MKSKHIITELDRGKWYDFVRNHPHGNIFQTPHMYEVFGSAKHWKPVVLAVVDDEEDISGLVLGVIQKEGEGFFGKFTARSVIWGGPLIRDEGDIETMAQLLKALDGVLKERALYIQFRNLYDVSHKKACFLNNGYEYEDHLNFLMDLDRSEEELWGQLRTSKRNKVRNAQKKKINVRFASSLSDVDESYGILREIYKRIKLPLPGKNLFKAMYDKLSPEGMVKIFLAAHEGRTIGALYLLAFRERVYVFYAGSLLKYYDKHPNDLLYWEAMKWGAREGYKVFDFGGAGSPGKEYGVREFKKELGGKLVNYGRFKKTYLGPALKIVKTGLKIWQKI